jgi:hypothetical protein
MTNATRKAVITSFALLAAALEGSYGAHLLARLADRRLDTAVRQVVVSAAALQLAWAALSIWAARHPFRGRFLLLFTAGAMLLGNILTDASRLHAGAATWGAILPNLAVGCLVAGAFVGAYMLGEPATAKGNVPALNGGE